MGNNLRKKIRIGIVGHALAPNFNEACANQMCLLSKELNAPVLTCNNLGIIPFKKMNQYLIVNGKFLSDDSRNPILSLANGTFFYPFLKLFERKCDVVFLSGGINSGFLCRLDLGKCILIMNSLPYTRNNKELTEFSREISPKLKGIIAQSQRIKNKLLDTGVELSKIHLIYPWADLNKFKPTEPPDLGEFKILFASAPNAEMKREDILKEKGVSLLLEAFQEFLKNHRASLRFLWRGYCNAVLYRKIEELRPENKVRVINRIVDTARFFSESHITVIPFLNSRRSPEIPLSAIESLASGRPIVTTDVGEIAEIVAKYRCGCIAKPTKEEFTSALAECRKNYLLYQANCRKTAEELFMLKMEQFLGDLSKNGQTS